MMPPTRCPGLYIFNDYFNKMSTLYKTLKQMEKALNPRMKAMGVKMNDKLNKYYESFVKVNIMVLIAMILDPRKKDELCVVLL